MKYLLDIPSCLSKSKALFDKSGLEIYALFSTSNYIALSRGRTSPSVLDGGFIFYHSNVKTITDTGGYLGKDGFIKFLNSKYANKYTIVSDAPKTLNICKQLNLKTIKLLELEKLIEFDDAKYKQALSNKEIFSTEINKVDQVRIGLFIIIFTISIFMVLINKIVGLISIFFIFPISILIGGMLYKIKKTNLLFYSIFQLIFAIILAFIIYNFEENDFTTASKSLSLLSTIFIITKAFENIDNYMIDKKNKYSKWWNFIF